MGKTVGLFGIAFVVMLGGCEQRSWTEDEIASIAYDAAIDAAADSASFDGVDARISALEATVSEQESEIDELEFDLLNAQSEIADLEARLY